MVYRANKPIGKNKVFFFGKELKWPIYSIIVR